MRKFLFRAGRPAELVEAPVPVPGRGQLLGRTEAVGVGIGLVRMLEPGGVVRPGAEMVGTVAAASPAAAGFEVGDRVGGVVFEDAYAEIVLAHPPSCRPCPRSGGRRRSPGPGARWSHRAQRAPGRPRRTGRVSTGHRGGQRDRSPGRATGQGVPSAPGGGRRRVGGQGRLRPPVRSRRGGDRPPAILGRPVDLVLDGVGGELVQRGVHALAPFGRLVAFSAGGGTVDAGSLLGELKSVIGFSIGLVSRTRPDLVIQRRTELWDLLAAGRLNPRYVDLPLEEITKAIDLVATRSNLGRVVLRTR